MTTASSRPWRSALTLALLAIIASPAVAQIQPSDAKCLLVSNIFAKVPDAEANKAAVQARYFYLGRMTGSPAQIEAAIAAQSKTVTAENAGATMKACARTVLQKVSEVEAVGQRLSKTRPK